MPSPIPSIVLAPRASWVQRVVGALAGPRGRGPWPARQSLVALVCVAAFIGLTWVRAASLAVMLPGVVNLGLGLCTGLLGHSLSYWMGRLGVPATHACPVAKALKLGQIVGVPTGYLLLGGHMLALPLLGAALALAALGWAHRRGRGCGRVA